MFATMNIQELFLVLTSITSSVINEDNAGAFQEVFREW